jgi:hypothetical protein
LRERDDEVRALKDEVRVMRERAERMSKREREHEERWKIKDNDVQVSQRVPFGAVFAVVLWFARERGGDTDAERFFVAPSRRDPLSSSRVGSTFTTKFCLAS